MTKKLKDFAHKRQVKHTSTVMEFPNPFDTLVKLVVADNTTNGKIGTLSLPLEIINVTSKLAYQILSPEPFDPNP